MILFLKRRIIYRLFTQTIPKLVRDKIPEIISSNNETPVTRILSDLEYKEELEKKLYEEYLEVLTSTGKIE